MKHILLCAAVVASLAVPAHANHTSYTGGCTKTVAQIPMTITWTGTVSASVVANSPVFAITVDCVLIINGVWQGVVLTASGTGSASGAAPVTYDADVVDVVEICEIVTIEGETTVFCHP